MLFRSYCLALLLLPVSLMAQEYKDYASAAGKDLPLYRAQVAQSYSKPSNGTYLLDNKGFLQGEISIAGKVYEGILLNLDAVLHHVLVRQEGSPITLDLGREQIDWFTREGRRYVNLSGTALSEGFYELVEKGNGAVYKRVDKALSHLHDVTASAREYIGYDDPYYKEGLLDFYELKETWFLVSPDGSVRRLRSKRSINKAIQYVRTAN